MALTLWTWVSVKQAQAKADVRRRAANATPSKMTTDIVTVIETTLCEEQLSPEQISGWMRATEGVCVSHEWIPGFIIDKGRCRNIRFCSPRLRHHVQFLA